MLRRLAIMLALPLLASCQPPHIVVRAVFLGNALAFVAADPDDSDSLYCWSGGTVIDETLRPSWRFTGSGLGDCRTLFPLYYGRAPASARAETPASRLEPGRLYLFIGDATASAFGAFAFTQTGSARIVHNIDPDSPVAAEIRERWWRRAAEHPPETWPENKAETGKAGRRR